MTRNNGQSTPPPKVLSTDQGTTDLDLGLDIEQGEHGLHVDERLPQLPVHGAEEVERDRELEEQPVHHDQVTHRHVAWEQRQERSLTNVLPAGK